MRSVVESRKAPALRAPRAGARHGAVQGVADGGDAEDERRPDEVAGEDQRHGDDVQQQADDGEHVGRDAARASTMPTLKKPRRAPSV